MARQEETIPGCQSITLILEAKRVGEIVAASPRDHQHRDFQPGEFAEIMVEGSVAAQDNRGIGGGQRLSALVANNLAIWAREQSQVLGRYVRAEDGDGAHAAGFNHK
jgi:hypothetical protein